MGTVRPSCALLPSRETPPTISRYLSLWVVLPLVRCWVSLLSRTPFPGATTVGAPQVSLGPLYGIRCFARLPGLMSAMALSRRAWYRTLTFLDRRRQHRPRPEHRLHPARVHVPQLHQQPAAAQSRPHPLPLRRRRRRLPAGLMGTAPWRPARCGAPCWIQLFPGCLPACQACIPPTPAPS